MEDRQEKREVEDLSEKLQKCLSISPEDKMEKYNRLYADGKNAAKQGDIQKALELFKVAYKIYQTEKLKRKISQIEELLAQNDSEDEDVKFINVNNSGLMLFQELHNKLYDYQRDGVSFLYGLYRDGRKGGILADDMGLGKTIQVISFLSGMYDNEQIKHTLLVMPTSLITNWIKEFAKWTPGMRVKEFHGIDKAERTRSLEKVQKRKGVVITTYTMLARNWQQLSSYKGKQFCWDYVILDEAHKIKSTSTKTAKSAYAIPSKNRILLTGTPVQNNLKEMWTLFDFACQGALLGTAKTFKTEYENPITRAREKDATPGEQALGARMSENLMTLIKPYFLRRTKSEVQKKKSVSKEEHSDNQDIKVKSDPADSGADMPNLTRKNDLIVWTYLSRIQEEIYRQFLELDHIKELLMTTRSPLAELTILKKLCDHPRLLSAGAIAKLGLEENGTSQSENTVSDTNIIANVPDDTLVSESGKLVFLLALLERLREEGHRTLVFAHYRKVLDILQRILGNRGFKVLRLDGTITQITERERLISLFQKDKRYSVFLLTTQVGGVGITLTAADRVVIYDPSWNPATDAQAVDRAYRIGQTENVVIYRLITCGTVEEKIYRRQVFKDSLIRQNTGDKKNPFRYFSRQELRELFTLQDTRSSSTQLQLQAMHSRHRRTDPELDEHIAHLHSMDMFGISDHDLMFSLDLNHDEALENQEEYHYIEGRVQKAQDLMRAESELQMQLVQNLVPDTEPAWMRRPADNTQKKKSNEKKTRNPKPGPVYPQPGNSFITGPAGVNLDQPGSGEENHQTLMDQPGSGEENHQTLMDQPGSGEENHQTLMDQPGSGEENHQNLMDQPGSGEENHQTLMDQPGSGEENHQTLMDQPGSGEENHQNLMDQPGSGEETHQNPMDQPGSGAETHQNPMDQPGPGEETHQNLMDQPGSGEETHQNPMDQPGSGAETHQKPMDQPGSGEETHQNLMDQPGSGEETHQNPMDQPGSGEETHQNLMDQSGSGEETHQNLMDQPGSGEETHQNLMDQPGSGEETHQNLMDQSGSGEETHQNPMDQPGSGAETHQNPMDQPGSEEDNHQNLMDQSGSGEETHQNLMDQPGSGEETHQNLMDQSGSGEETHQNPIDQPGSGAETHQNPIDQPGSGAETHQNPMDQPGSEEDNHQNLMDQPGSGAETHQNPMDQPGSGEESSSVSPELDSVRGDFLLQLEDAETEEEEQQLLSQLQMDGSFDVNTSLSESLSRRRIGSWRPSDGERSMDGSPVLPRRKRAAVIYDSEEEEEQPKSRLNSSFQVLGASTPKSAAAGSPHQRSRRSLGGNASKVSLLRSIMEDMDDQEVTLGKEEHNDGDISGMTEEEKRVRGNSAVGKRRRTIKTRRGQRRRTGGRLKRRRSRKKTQTKPNEKRSVSLEEGSGEPELDSGERMDACTVELSVDSDSYESLVRRGRECYSQAKLDQALDFFLRAIDIQPGDPEVQFMTIQLYRQRSQRP